LPNGSIPLISDLSSYLVAVGFDNHRPHDARRAGTLLDLLNRDHRTAWTLVGRLRNGRQTGAWEIEDSSQRAALKMLHRRSSCGYLDDMAALIATARSRGWPTPVWHAWGLDNEGHPYTLTEFVEGEHPERLDDAVLDELLDVIERQRGIAGRSRIDWADARQSVFGDGSRWRSALDHHSPAARAAGEAIARLARPFQDVDLPDCDLVHTDFGLHNVLFRDGRAVAVVDVEGIGSGCATIDLATLLFGAHWEAAEECVLDRLVAHAVARDGAPALAVCLASSLFDWAIFATSGWKPDEVVAFLEKSALLFQRFV
jgi:aminoglycoside phosphotransferase (APT) family kinase protein